MKRPRLVVSVGCPSGIGPEVSVVAAAASGARVLLVGDLGVLRRAARSRGVDELRLVRVSSAPDGFRVPARAIAVLEVGASLDAVDVSPGEPSRVAGAAQLAWIDAACDIAARGDADAMVTGPVSKAAIVRSRAPGSAAFLGHTEHLQRRLRAREVVMAFSAGALTTALATTHLALADVPRAVTPAKVSTATFWLGALLARLAGRTKRAQKIAVAAMNPHAGEGGLLGREERTAVTPGIRRARARLARGGFKVELVGPVPAETAFRLANAGAFDGVVAMYHDQATIPMKLVGFGEAVNVSLGLPIVRTSVDHGTGYDRAARFDADPRGMIEAMRFAERLVTPRRK